MTSVLALRFDAPMQSWGSRSRGVDRDTALEPTKSGVVGLLAAALGVERDQDEEVARLAALRFGVRVDREGTLERDYHVTQNVPTTSGGGHRTVVSERFYLADALFLVLLEGPHDELERIAEALADPHYRVYFGRKAFVPARPMLPPGTGPRPGTIEQAIAEHPRLGTTPQGVIAELRTVVDCAPTHPRAEARHDHPVSFAQGKRKHRTRTVVVDTATPAAGGTPCT